MALAVAFGSFSDAATESCAVAVSVASASSRRSARLRCCAQHAAWKSKGRRLPAQHAKASRMRIDTPETFGCTHKREEHPHRVKRIPRRRGVSQTPVWLEAIVLWCGRRVCEQRGRTREECGGKLKCVSALGGAGAESARLFTDWRSRSCRARDYTVRRDPLSRISIIDCEQHFGRSHTIVVGHAEVTVLRCREIRR